jgi:hypothetical protein
MRTALALSLGAIAAAALLTMPVAAHHGWGANSKDLELTATVVTPVSLSGPHATMRVRDAGGQVWNVTLAPAPRSHAAGLRDGMPPAGSTVRLVGRRNDNQKVFEIKTRRVIWDGKTFDVYPQ